MKHLYVMISSVVPEFQSVVPVNDVLVSTNFFIAIFAGLVIALAFQFILTAISVAAGVSAIGNIKKNYVKSKVNSSGNEAKENYGHDQDDSSDMSTGVKISTGFGIWSVVTTCIALFGATALALNISVVESTQTNIVTSLVIWGLFFLILFYLESKIASSLIGGLVSAATSGLKSSASAISSMFTPGPESKIEDVIGTTIDRLRSEFDSGLNSDKLSGVLDNFLSKVDKKLPDYDELKGDLEDIAKKSSSKGQSSGQWMAVQQMLGKIIDKNEDSGDSDRKEKAEKLKEMVGKIKERYNESPGKVEGVKNVVEEFTSLDKQEIDDRIKTVQDYLSTGDSENLTADKIESKFREIIDNPSMITSLISNKAKNLDREKVIGLLDKNTNLKKEDLEKYADSIESSIKKITSEFDGNNDDSLVKGMESKVEGFFDGTGRSELEYSKLKDDVKGMLDNPKDSLDIIKSRFSTFDSDTLKALVTNNKYIQEDQINSVVSTLENSKKEVQDKVSQIEMKAKQQVEMLKKKAVIQAEHARATAASAAWWLVLTTILSGVAAMAGSAVAL